MFTRIKECSWVP